MPFIDWNGDGKIDPVDIGISIATETDDEDPPVPQSGKSKGGCLTSVLIVLSIVALIMVLVGCCQDLAEVFGNIMEKNHGSQNQEATEEGTKGLAQSAGEGRGQDGSPAADSLVYAGIDLGL